MRPFLFESPHETQGAERAAKGDKYNALEPKLKRSGYKKVVVSAIVVGALES